MTKINAEWKLDCGGKQDYDSNLIKLDTRYWPGSYQDNGMISAKSTIFFENIDIGTIYAKEFEGESEHEVKIQVEKWCNEKYEMIISLLKNGLSINKNVVAEFEAELSETWPSGQQRYYEFVTDKREVYEEQGKKYKITIQEIK